MQTLRHKCAAANGNKKQRQSIGVNSATCQQVTEAMQKCEQLESHAHKENERMTLAIEQTHELVQGESSRCASVGCVADSQRIASETRTMTEKLSVVNTHMDTLNGMRETSADTLQRLQDMVEKLKAGRWSYGRDLNNHWQARVSRAVRPRRRRRATRA